MTKLYEIEDTSGIYSPGLVIFRDLLQFNLEEMVRVAGGPQRLRPHCKTHKTREVIKMQLELGIDKHKCATIAEAEMLADTGVKDILIAYQLVGPNVGRMVQLMDKFPNVRFASLVDCPQALTSISDRMSGSGKTLNLLLDLDPGMKRTGIEPGPMAIQLYEMMATSPGIQADGLHWYDGHNRQDDLDERRSLVSAGWKQFVAFRDQLMLSGIGIDRVVTAGTGSFPILAEMGEPNIELSPGTVTFHDAAMVEKFPEMKFKPALGVLTRVISKNLDGHLTLDVGHKSCAADQPAGKRLWFPDVTDAVEVQQTEEHCVIKTVRASEYSIGDHLISIPRHACPTVAVHQFASIIVDNKVDGRWDIVGRDRILTI